MLPKVPVYWDGEPNDIASEYHVDVFRKQLDFSALVLFARKFGGDVSGRL